MRPTSRAKFFPTWRDHLRDIEERHRQRQRDELQQKKAQQLASTVHLFLGSTGPPEEFEQLREAGESGALRFPVVRHATPGFETLTIDPPAVGVKIPVDGLYDVHASFRVSQAGGASFIAPRFVVVRGARELASTKHDWLLKLSAGEQAHFVDDLEVRCTEDFKAGDVVEVIWANDCVLGSATARLESGQLRLQRLA